MNDIAQTLEELGAPLTEHRRQLLDRVLAQRTNHFAMVLEDLYDPHNISAVIRTSEVFGFQDVHIIEEINRYRINKSILKGSFKWLRLYRYRQRALAMQHLRTKGYQIAVASTNTTKTIHELDLSKPTAFYLGAELKGNHPETLEQADVHFILPQYGVTESMNVSVAAGVLMSNLDMYMRQHGGRENFVFSETEKQLLLKDWYERCRFGVEHNSPVIDIRAEGATPAFDGEREERPKND